METKFPSPSLLFENYLGTKQGSETVSIVDIIVIEFGTAVIARYPRIVLIVLLGKPLPNYCFHSNRIPQAGSPESEDTCFSYIPKNCPEHKTIFGDGSCHLKCFLFAAVTNEDSSVIIIA